MSQITKDQFIKLREALMALPEELRRYATRFAVAHSSLSVEQAYKELERELGNRDEAARLEKHRKDKIISQFQELDDDTKKAALVQLSGVAASSSTNAVKS
jgi:hypothetical protein